jgi:hypothetical protein
VVEESPRRAPSASVSSWTAVGPGPPCPQGWPQERRRPVRDQPGMADGWRMTLRGGRPPAWSAATLELARRRPTMDPELEAFIALFPPADPDDPATAGQGLAAPAAAPTPDPTTLAITDHTVPAHPDPVPAAHPAPSWTTGRSAGRRGPAPTRLDDRRPAGRHLATRPRLPGQLVGRHLPTPTPRPHHHPAPRPRRLKASMSKSTGSVPLASLIMRGRVS